MKAKTIYLIIAVLVVGWFVSDIIRSVHEFDYVGMKNAIQEQITADWIGGSGNIGTITVLKIKPSNWIKIDKVSKTYSCDMKITGNYTLRDGKPDQAIPFEINHKMEVIKGKPRSIRRAG
ncbi:MAG: hypothetical protein CVU48_06300 [Candidatus Cloacimonetes bacterium HGW-Cloacimonetes-1]|jgi:hypothetical protein|nr:MAG: hypothetical protein CVU48_06300 [Candidatus Cloacimonetes bacterium HGW-Cloacimonetes-1]